MSDAGKTGGGGKNRCAEVAIMSDQVESRRTRRQRVLKGATIINGMRNSEIGCTVRNQSDNGAELHVAVDAHIPNEFLLYVPVDSVAYRAELRWRRNHRVGVVFHGVEPKPRLHYG